MQWRTVLVGVHHTPASVQALRAAAHLAAGARARLVVVRVNTTPSRDATAEPPAEQLRRELEPLVGQTVPPDRILYHGAFGVPAVELPRAAEALDAELVVLGRQSAGADRPELGATLSGTVNRIRVPCLTAPLGQLAIHRVLAAVDEGSEAERVLEVAALAARQLEATLISLHVEPLPTFTERAAAGHTWGGGTAGGAAGGSLATAVQPKVEGLAGYEGILRRGDPVSEILKTVHEERIDLLVHGYHRGGLTGPDMECLAHRLLRRAPCAVLTVPV